MQVILKSIVMKNNYLDVASFNYFDNITFFDFVAMRFDSPKTTFYYPQIMIEDLDSINSFNFFSDS